MRGVPLVANVVDESSHGGSNFLDDLFRGYYRFGGEPLQLGRA